MWSGPRTLSTATMRAWENRADTVVVDEPLYAYYLAATGLDHPGRDDVLASQPTDWRTVVRTLTEEPLPAGATISYQKHMTHHVLPEVDLGQHVVGHVLLVADRRAGREGLLGQRADDGPPVRRLAGEDVVASGVVEARRREVVGVERLVDDDGVGAVLPRAHG